MGIILYILSYILNTLFTPFAVLYTLIRKWNATDWYFKEIAIAADRKGNVTCQVIFNDVLIKREGCKFGDPFQTVSFILARNKKDKTLTVLGSIICSILILLNDKAFK